MIENMGNSLIMISQPTSCFQKHGVDNVIENMGIPCKIKHGEFPDGDYMADALMIITWDGGSVSE